MRWTMGNPASRSTIRVGTQGWNYPAWVGPFYPANTRAVDFLRTYAKAFEVVEIDSTFYAIPPVSTCLLYTSPSPRD